MATKKRTAKAPTTRRPGHKALLYTANSTKKIEVTLPVATPAEIREALNLSRAERQRVERAIAKAGLSVKNG